MSFPQLPMFTFSIILLLLFGLKIMLMLYYVYCLYKV